MQEKTTILSDTLLKGRLTEIKVATFFLELGYIISTPIIPCQYDFLLDVNNKIYKLQVKTCRSVEGGIEFNTSSITHNSLGYTKRIYASSMVDFFCTYYNDNCYLIPFNECGSKAKKLRVDPTKNGQTKNICFAEDYLAIKILKTLG